VDADAIRRSYADAKPRPFWLDQADAPQATEPLAGEHEADLVVVGGGLTGLWAALLAREEEPQREVVLLEGERIAFGASGRNGGFMDASLTHGIENGAARWPDEMPELERLGRENFAAIKDTIARRDIEANLEQTGELAFATAPYQADYIPEMIETARSFGWAAEALDAEEARAQVHSPTYHGGVYLPDSCAVLDPARLAPRAPRYLSARRWSPCSPTGPEWWPGRTAGASEHAAPSWPRAPFRRWCVPSAATWCPSGTTFW
jgi:hypothetical protein